MAETAKKKKPKAPTFSILLYGEAGAGKSILANTFPKPLIFDFDGGHKLYEKHFPNNTYVRDGNMIGLLQTAVQQVKDGTFKYKTIVIDSLTNLENQAISLRKGITADNWVTSLYTSGGRKMEYDDWGAVSGSTIAILTELRAYDINVVIITQVGLGKDGGRNYFTPNLIGKGATEALHFPSFVGYMTKDEGSRFLHLTNNIGDNFVAKARLISGDVPPIKNPNYEKLATLIEDQEMGLDFSE